MARADMHVHSKYSSNPTEWLLKQIGSAESYTDPDEIYLSAKSRGMQFVTITDHNAVEGVLILQGKHPEDVFTGVELTATFPEDQCRVHVLVYGFTAGQFAELDRARHNVYDLRDYLRNQKLTHSVAHATFPVSRLLQCEHLEKLILLFDVFEGINASRNAFSNDTWRETLTSLSPERIESLRQRHGIEPFGDTPWIKGFTGGSDDHAGLFIGKGYTASETDTAAAFLAEVREKRALCLGESNSYRELATAIYKISYEFTHRKKPSKRWSLVSALNAGFFGKRLPWLSSRIAIYRLKSRYAHRFFSNDLTDFLQQLGRMNTASMDEKLPLLYSKLTRLVDGFIAEFAATVGRNGSSIDLERLIAAVYSMLPGVCLSLPFISSLKHMFENRELITGIRRRIIGSPLDRPQKILWFTDTLDDLNGVSVTIQNFMRQAAQRNLQLRAVSCMPVGKVPAGLEDLTINLPVVTEYTPPFYSSYTLRIPSLLASIERIYQQSPELIVVSTPGPVGLLGLLLSRLLNIPSTAIYHTDFTAQAQEILGETYVLNALEWYTRLFYQQFNRIKVPTAEYMDILSRRAFPRERMSIFRRGIDTARYAINTSSKTRIQQQFGLAEGVTLLYAGRVSQDKSIDFLGDVYRRLLKERPDLNLIIAGYGPYLDEFRARMKEFPRVIFTGRVGQEIMPHLYAGSDLLVFPSTTDTFGMVVLEGQASGLPAVVSDVGGPQEIIHHNETGLVVRAHSIDDWVAAIRRLLMMMDRAPEVFLEMRYQSRVLAERMFSWDAALEDITAKQKKDYGEIRDSLAGTLSKERSAAT